MSDFIFPNAEKLFDSPGLTKREFFAAMAMQGALHGAYKTDLPSIVQMAVDAADLLIDELDLDASARAAPV